MDGSTPGFLSITNPQSLFKLVSITLVMSSKHLILCCPFFSCLQSFPASVFSKESVLRIRGPKCWNYSFNISPSNEYSGLISFRMDWFDLLEVQRTLKSLFQHDSSKASILRCLDFFIVQEKTEALTRQTVVSKVMYLFFLIGCLVWS